MALHRNQTARQVAWQILTKFEPGKTDVVTSLHKQLEQTDQKAAATDLVYGVVRNCGCLDMLIDKLAKTPSERIPAKLRSLLRIGVYEMVYCSGTPDYAIVNEAVIAAGKIAGRKQSGFVNAVLRQVQRSIKQRQVSFCELSNTRVLPVTQQTGCQFNNEILPAPRAVPAKYLSMVFSLPRWLVGGWIDGFGFDKSMQICFGLNRRPSVYVRPNKLRCTIEELVGIFESNQIEFAVCSDKKAIQIHSHADISSLPGFNDGLFYVQDLTASEVVEHMDIKKGSLVCDLCSAPGGKTIQLAQAVGALGKVIATDINTQRLEQVKQNCERLGLSNVDVIAYEDFIAMYVDKMLFDAILLDVPCSNTGTLAKRCEVRWRLKLRAIEKLVETQRQILEFACSMVKRDGTLCYSTCSIEKSENQDVIESFLASRNDFALRNQRLALPHGGKFDCDGGFSAVLGRK